VFSPITGEYDLAGKHPGARETLRAVDGWQACTEELQGAVAPELDLIESRVAAPLKEFQGVLKTIRKTITKREHKVRAAPGPRGRER
jgi:amphiphysin